MTLDERLDAARRGFATGHEDAVGADDLDVALDAVRRRAAAGSRSDRTPGPPGSPVRWVAAAAVVAVVALAVTLLAWPDEAEQVDTGPAPTPTTDAPSPSTTATTATSGPTDIPTPSGVRGSPVQVWTGSEYLVWGGRRGDGPDLTDGWRFDPATGEVTPIPAAPVPSMTDMTGAWNGSELVVCCGTATTADGAVGAAAYDPATDRWRTIAPPPASAVGEYGPGGIAGISSAEEVLFVTASNDGGETTELHLLAYEIAADRWRELTPPRSIGRQGQVHRTDDGFILWTTPPGGGDAGQHYDVVEDHWEDLPPLPAEPRPWYASSVWTGEELVVWGISQGPDTTVTVGYRWRPGDSRWRPMAPAPIDPVRWGEWTPGSQAMGYDEVTGLAVAVSVHPGDGEDPPRTVLTYDPRADEWGIVGSMPGLGYSRTVVVADGKVLVPDDTRPVALDLPR